MQQRVFREANCRSVGQEINRLLWTVFITVRHWPLSWARWIQSTPSHTNSLRSILMLSSYICQGLPSGLLPSGFPTKILYAFLMFTCVLHASPVPSFLTRTFVAKRAWRQVTVW